MKKALTIAAATMALTGVLLAGATSALATPTKKVSCSNCHAPSTAVILTVTPVKAPATAKAVTYKIKITGGKGKVAWAVLSGGKNIAHALSPTGTFKAKKGTVITVWAVKKGTGSTDTTITVN